MLARTENTVSFIKDFEQQIEKFGKNDPSWLKTYRSESVEQLGKLGFPTIKDENWRFTNIAPILKEQFSLGSPGKIKEDAFLKRYTQGDVIKIVFVNGFYNKELSTIGKLGKGVSITTLFEAFSSDGAWLQKGLNKFNTKEEKKPFVALNKAGMQDGVAIKIDDKAVIKDLIHVIFITQGKSVSTFPRNLIVLGKSSEASVLESHLCLNDSDVYFSNPMTEMFVAENASLNYCKAQKQSLKSYHIGISRVYQERNSNFNGFSMIAGAALSRHDLDVILDGEGASGMLNGLYSLVGTQLADNHTCVEHREPNCTSNQLYKGILNNSSRAVFNGKILVSPIAQKTNSYQLNKNLLLGKDAQVNTKPQLEIGADDVKCTHGATIGQLNEDEIFYLQSRCISRKTATKMLAVGFVDDALEHIQNKAVIDKLHILLEPSLAAL